TGGFTTLLQSPVYDAATRTLTIRPASQLGDGRFSLTLSGITSAAGNALVAAPYVFYFRPGDANGDGIVGFDDLLILAQNYRKAGQTFSEGNFNYSADRVVEFEDLLILAHRYNTSLVVAELAAQKPSTPAKRRPNADLI